MQNLICFLSIGTGSFSLCVQEQREISVTYNLLLAIRSINSLNSSYNHQCRIEFLCSTFKPEPIKWMYAL